METLNISAAIKDGVTLDELFTASEERLKELFTKYPGPEVTITYEDENTNSL